VWRILTGLALIGVGFLFLKNPDIFRRGIWMKTSIAIRTLSEDNYRRFIRVLGIASIAIGVAEVARALLAYSGVH
jgi:hypothetical protein